MTKIRTLMAIGLVVGMLAFASNVLAIGSVVGLGTAGSFVVLAGSTVTNTGPSVLNGDLGLSPGSAVTGFPPGTLHGVRHVADAAALQAEHDLTTAYTVAAGQPADATVSANLGGRSLVPGVYKSATSLALTGTVTLNAAGDPNAVWVFQAGSTLTTASDSRVLFVNGAQPCNVFWQVGSSATLGTRTVFGGTILALTSVTLQTGASVNGRVLARNGAVTLDTNVITRPVCAASQPTATPTALAAPGATPTAAPSAASTVAPQTTAAPPIATATAVPSATPVRITRGPAVIQPPTPHATSPHATTPHATTPHATTPPTDTLPAAASRGTPVTLGGTLLALGGLLVLASAGLVLRRPARR